MTYVKIKSPIMRRPIEIESVSGQADYWRMTARGYLPLEFSADSITDAVETAMRMIGSLTADPHYSPRRRQAAV